MFTVLSGESIVAPEDSCRFRAMAQTVKPVQLNPQTLEAFDAYIRNAETEMEQTLHGDAPFLWSQQSPKRAQDIRQGKVVAQSRWRAA